MGRSSEWFGLELRMDLERIFVKVSRSFRSLIRLEIEQQKINNFKEARQTEPCTGGGKEERRK